ncbi:unnamed protein product [Psylliodes chrysocephalus]|uniref:Odorant receptor n=1 Tax=Psylliodes chrysocephalus TaxID=3402493 RepID=A0A9P0GEG2_9CUCU|nr:unnamed protein product [Psylliodes chrysocephala]
MGYRSRKILQMCTDRAPVQDLPLEDENNKVYSDIDDSDKDPDYTPHGTPKKKFRKFFNLDDLFSDENNQNTNRKSKSPNQEADVLNNSNELVEPITGAYEQCENRQDDSIENVNRFCRSLLKEIVDNIVKEEKGVLLIVLRPFFNVTEEFDPVLNKTVVVRIHAISTWFPFDETKHYYAGVIFQIPLELVFTVTMISVDMFTHSLIIHPLTEIRILTHIFQNFDKYVSKVKIDCGYDDATASFATLRECILLHKRIIKYVDDYNLVMSNVTLFDYLQSSLEFATIILQLNGGKSKIYGLVFVVTGAAGILSRLFISYWYADQLTSEASDIAQALFESNWYEQTKEIKKIFSIIIMRCSKEIALFIGPFDKMSMRIFLAVSKILCIKS